MWHIRHTVKPFPQNTWLHFMSVIMQKNFIWLLLKASSMRAGNWQTYSSVSSNFTWVCLLLFSEIDNILGKVLELLSAANSTILSIFISSTRSDKYAAHYKTLCSKILFLNILETLPPPSSQTMLSFLFLRLRRPQHLRTQHWIGGLRVLENYC